MVRYAVICASNQNRSMEAHNVLSKHGFNVCSFGTGNLVRLPGPSIDRPNIYPFGTPYDKIYKELKQKDPNLYQANGLLNMLDRNRKVKEAPQRWHEQQQIFDVIITCEERCFDAVVEDLSNRGQAYNKSVHVINVEIKDNHDEAYAGGKGILWLAQKIEDATDIEAEIDEILEEFGQKFPNFPVIHTIAYF